MKKLFIFGLIALTSFNATAQIPDYLPTTNLIAWWPLNDNLVDSVSNTYNGIGNNFTYTENRFNDTNSACDFSNVSGYVQFSGIPVNLNGSYSFNYWIKLKTYQDYDVITDLHPSSSCGNFPQIWEMYDSLFIVKCNVVSSRRGLGSKAEFVNKWKMVTWVVKSDTTSIYIDGELRAQFPYIWANSTTAVLTLANTYNSLNQFNAGAQVIIDEVSMWDRLLTPCEIANIYNQSPDITITSQPINQNDTVGGSVSFTVGATPSTSTYQWQSNVGTGNTFINLTNSGQYSGVNTTTLTVAPLTALNDGQLFRCIVNDETGVCASISDTALLTITTISAIAPYTYLSGSYLGQNVPNPAEKTTVIPYYIKAFKHNAVVEVCDITGRVRKTVFLKKAGEGTITTAKDELEAGIYFYRLVVDGFTLGAKKMVLR